MADNKGKMAIKGREKKKKTVLIESYNLIRY